MSVSDDVRSKIRAVELAIEDAGTVGQINAILDTLKAIAGALETVDQGAGRAAQVTTKPAAASE